MPDQSWMREPMGEGKFTGWLLSKISIRLAPWRGEAPAPASWQGMSPETAVGQSVGRVPSRGGTDATCPVRRVRGPGLQPDVAHHDPTPAARAQKRPGGTLKPACPHAAAPTPHARCAGSGDPAYNRASPTTTSPAGRALGFLSMSPSAPMRRPFPRCGTLFDGRFEDVRCMIWSAATPQGHAVGRRPPRDGVCGAIVHGDGDNRSHAVMCFASASIPFPCEMTVGRVRSGPAGTPETAGRTRPSGLTLGEGRADLADPTME